MNLIDQYKRKISYLRLAVTDRCNLRCRYCMPEEGIAFADRKDLMTYEEIIRLAHIFKSVGVDKIRITGGEPFVRKGMTQLILQLYDIIPAIHITTNATVIGKYLEQLQGKVKSLNISLDTLDKDKFMMVTKRDKYEEVMSNILKSLEMGFTVKVNAVVMKGINDNEMVDFVKFGQENNIEVRFIEAMPFNEFDGNKHIYMPVEEMVAMVKETYPSLSPIDHTDNSSSLTYKIDSGHKVGFIPAYSRSLCGSCNRIRLTPKGQFLTCLYASEGLDLLSLIRDEKYDDAQLIQAIKDKVWKKKINGFVEEEERGQTVFESMTTIGG